MDGRGYPAYKDLRGFAATRGEMTLVFDQQTAVRWLGDAVEARFLAGLPAQRRRILGRAAADLLCARLPELVSRSLHFAALREEELRHAVETNEDAEAIRRQLRERGLVAFVANGAVLPRRSGID